MITAADLIPLHHVAILLDLELAEHVYMDADHPLLTAATDIDIWIDDYESGYPKTYLSLFNCIQNALDALECGL